MLRRARLCHGMSSVRPSICDVHVCRQYRAKLLNVTQFVSVVEAAEDTTNFAEINNKQKHAQIRASVAENADRTVPLITGQMST